MAIPVAAVPKVFLPAEEHAETSYYQAKQEALQFSEMVQRSYAEKISASKSQQKTSEGNADEAYQKLGVPLQHDARHQRNQQPNEGRFFPNGNLG
jgi:hypothetical protein